MSVFPQQYIKTLVSIEIDDKDEKGIIFKRSVASAFVFGEQTSLTDQYALYLVTNRHVFKNEQGEVIKNPYVRLNVGDTAKHYKLTLFDPEGKQLWIEHPNPEVDLAVVQLWGQMFIDEHIDFAFFTESSVFTSTDFANAGIAPGNGVFVLGFPMGIRGEEKNQIIVRQGIVSRVDEEVLSHKYYYIDTAAFPGNSGGPVISRPEMMAITGTKNTSESRLIGIVSSGVPYFDVAFSKQTGRARVVFEEQTGLVRIVPIDALLEITHAATKEINAALARNEKVNTTPGAAEEKVITEASTIEKI